MGHTPTFPSDDWGRGIRHTARATTAPAPASCTSSVSPVAHAAPVRPYRGTKY